MEKQRSAVVLVLLLLLILVGWWNVNAYYSRSSARTVLRATSFPVDTAYVPPESVLIQRGDSAPGQLYYAGMLVLPPCDTFSTQVTTTGGMPAHVTLAFQVLKYSSTCPSSTPIPSPFSISIGSQSTSTTQLDTVTINGVPVKVTTTED